MGIQIKKLLWLDDYRDPYEDGWLVFSPIVQPFEVHWVKSYNEFVDWIIRNNLPDGICFDHDLSDFQAFYANYPELMKEIPWPEYEKTGLDCVKWLLSHCEMYHLKVPKCNYQTANSDGKEKMKALIDNYNKR